MAIRRKTSGTLVVGMGRFGEAVATSLDAQDKEVLAIEKDRRLVQHFTGSTPIIECDATDPAALREAGAAEFSAAVVAIGSSVEASVLVTANLVDLGCESIWAKALTPEHGRILERIGAHHVIYPESAAGRRIAHLVGGHLLDYIELDKDELAVAKMYPPRILFGKPLGDLRVDTRFGIRVLGVIPREDTFEYADKSTVIEPGDVVVLSGSPADIDSFSERQRFQ